MGHDRFDAFDADDHMGGIRYPGTCTAVIGSMTLTIKAQNALAAASVRTSVTKISSGSARTGCAYGLIFPCIQQKNVTEILSSAGIRVRKILGAEV